LHFLPPPSRGLVEAASSRHKPRGRPAPIGSPSDRSRWDRLFRRHCEASPWDEAPKLRFKAHPADVLYAGTGGRALPSSFRCSASERGDRFYPKLAGELKPPRVEAASCAHCGFKSQCATSKARAFDECYRPVWRHESPNTAVSLPPPARNTAR
jgi:hypothetical protein